jgi:DNA-binding transcriptional MocR family regulator
MNEINQTFITLLGSVFKPEDRSPQNLAAFIAHKILNSELPLGHELFTQRELMSSLNISMTAAEALWSILKDELLVITTFRTNGTRVIDDLPDIMAQNIAAILEEPADMFHAANFSEMSFFGLAMSNEDFSKALQRDVMYALHHLSHTNSSGLMQKLEVQFVKLASNKLNYNVGKQEIYFNDQYKELLDYCCQAMLGKSKKFVMLDLSPAVVHRVLKHAGYDVHELSSARLQDRLIELENFCREHVVGLVYVSASSPFPFQEVLNNKFWHSFNEIQKKYRFTILLDDNLHLRSLSPVIFQHIEIGKNSNVIYISPPVMLHPKFTVVNYIVGTKEFINKIKAKFINKDPQIPIGTANALYNYIRKGNLVDDIQRFNVALQGRQKKVTEYLLSLDLFEARFIHAQEGWFYYLEPKAGTRFIDNIVQHLFYRKIYVMDRDLFNRDPKFSKGIMISVSAFHHDKACIRALERLAFNLSKMIIPDKVLVS